MWTWRFDEAIWRGSSRRPRRRLPVSARRWRRHADGRDQPEGRGDPLHFRPRKGSSPPTRRQTPFSDPNVSTDGYLIAPVADLVLMKLTSFRLKDKVHIQDMDGLADHAGNRAVALASRCASGSRGPRNALGGSPRHALNDPSVRSAWFRARSTARPSPSYEPPFFSRKGTRHGTAKSRLQDRRQSLLRRHRRSRRLPDRHAAGQHPDQPDFNRTCPPSRRALQARLQVQRHEDHADQPRARRS